MDFPVDRPAALAQAMAGGASVVHVDGTAVLRGIVLDALLIGDAPHLVRFATTQTYG